MIDRALPAKFGFHRRDGNAIGFLAAITAAFAHQFIDHDAFGRIGECSALATTTLFRCAGLVVNHDRRAWNVTQFALHRIQLIAMMHRDARREIGCRGVLFRLVCHDHNFARTFRCHLMRNHRYRQRTIDRLATRHRDGIVEQNFIGDVDLGCDRGANGQQAGVVVRAIAQIGENMFRLGEWLNTNPRHALPAHLCECHGLLRANPGRHVVAADSGERFRTCRYYRAGIVRATSAEGRYPGGFRARLLQRCFFVLDEFQTCFDNFGRVKLGDTFGNDSGNHCWCQFTRRR